MRSGAGSKTSYESIFGGELTRRVSTILRAETLT